MMKPFSLVAIVGAALLAWAATVQAGESPKPGEVPEAVRRAAVDGRFLLMQGRIDEAIQKFEAALAIYPDQPEAKSLLAQAQAKRAEAQQHYDKAATLAQAGKWDEAILEASAATGVYTAYKQAKELAADIRRRAANASVASATALLGKGNLPGAEDGFRRAMEYVPDFPPAGEGIGRTDFERARAAAAQGCWGAALVWVTEAVDYAPKKAEYAELAAAMRARVLERVRFAIAKGPPRPATEVVSAATVALEERTWQRLGQSHPEFLVVPGDPAFTGAAAYLVALDASEPQMHGGLARTEQRTFRYNIKREELNPEYANTRDQLNQARAYLAQLGMDYDQPCLFCGGGGVIVCRTCGGTGTIIGPPPGPCPVCSILGGRSGYTRCPHCGGMGRYSRVSYTELRRAEQDVARLQDLLTRTPQMIVRNVPADWSYSVEYHEKAGVMEYTLRIVSTESGRSIASETLRRDKRYQDTTVQNANPGIGLAADPLKLPADEEVRLTLLDEAGAEAANRVIAVTATARAAERQAESQRLTAEGHAVEAIEAIADAAILKEAVAKGQGMVLVGALRDRLRAEERRTPTAAKPL